MVKFRSKSVHTASEEMRRLVADGVAAHDAMRVINRAQLIQCDEPDTSREVALQRARNQIAAAPAPIVIDPANKSRCELFAELVDVCMRREEQMQEWFDEIADHVHEIVAPFAMQVDGFLSYPDDLLTQAFQEILVSVLSEDYDMAGPAVVAMIPGAVDCALRELLGLDECDDDEEDLDDEENDDDTAQRLATLQAQRLFDVLEEYRNELGAAPTIIELEVPA